MPDNNASACKYCGSVNIIKKGKRVSKLKEVQLLFCKDCCRRFSLQNFNNKTYPVSTIVSSLSLYNSGLIIDEVARKTNVPRSTLFNWITEYKALFSLSSCYKELQAYRQNHRIIESYKYVHHLVYLYQQHSFKVEMFVKANEPGLYKYLQKAKTGDFDNKIFLESNVRASKTKLNIIEQIKIKKERNYACKLVSLSLELVSDNYERHSAVEKIMIENDLSTIATEVPVFLQLSKSTIPWLKNIESANDYITGHIDILQYRNGKLYILDYKPNADKEKPLGQLFVYACCLSKTTGIKFMNIKLAWFDENVYYETGAMDVYKEVMKKNFNIKLVELTL